MKKEWIDDYKKTNSTYKLEEKNLMLSYTAEDYHLNKIMTNLLQTEVDNEAKSFEEIRKRLKHHINEVHSTLTGDIYKRSYDIRDKIYKIEEEIKANRSEFKSKFENLLFEEEKLEKELEEFDIKLTVVNHDQKGYDSSQEEEITHITDGNINTNSNKHTPHKNLIIQNVSASPSHIDDIINKIMNVTSLFDDVPTEVSKLVDKFTIKDSDTIKEKIRVIDCVIDKDLGGVNLTWSLRDHQDFLRLKAAHNSKVNTFDFLNDLESALPFLLRSELKNHIKGFNKFSKLIEVKKLLINKYKDLKDKQKNENKKEILNKLSENNNQAQEKIKPINNKDKLEEWKNQKVQEKKDKLEEGAKLEAERKEVQRMKYIEKTNKIKPMIEDYKKHKQINNYLMTTETNQNQVSREITEIDLIRINERNQNLIKKKSLLVKSKSLNGIRSAENYTKYRLKKWVKMETMQPKVTEVTENYQVKQRKKHDKEKDKSKEAFTMANNVLGRMTRAVPEWRKSLY